MKIKNFILLFLTAVIWGMAFVSQQSGMDYMGPLTFTAARNLIGGIVLIPVIFFIRRRIPGQKKDQQDRISLRKNLNGGIICGLALTAASVLQQYGLTMTTVGKGGFITTLYIIITPIIGILFHRKAPAMVWVCAGLAIVGMYLLCVDSGSFSVSPGDLLVLASSVIFAVHILVIDHFSSNTNGVVLSCIQFFVCGIVSTAGAFIFEQPSFGQLVSGAAPVIYAGVLSSGVGYTLQIIGQKGVNPTAAALILSLESVVASISGYVAYRIGFLKTDQTMTSRQIAGCAVVFLAVVLVQLPWEKIVGSRNNSGQ